MASYVEAPTISYQDPHRGPLPGSEAGDLVLPPLSVDSEDWCEEHEESLSMFCLDDLEPLCKHCAAENHTGHRVYLLTEAAIDCKEELKTSLKGLNKKMIHFMEVSQTYEHASKHNQAEAKLTEEHMKKEFEDLHQFLREEEAARLLALREEQQEKTRRAEEWIDQMNLVVRSLEGKIQLNEDELSADGDGVAFLQHYQDRMSSWYMSVIEPENICTPLINVAKHLGNLHYAVWKKMKHTAPYNPVTLDPRTAGRSLKVSPGLHSVQITSEPSQELEQFRGEVGPLPANPERFHPCSCILAREGFNSGVHCWDVEVSASSNWTLGVAAQSVSRRREFEACPEAGLWCISLRGGEYRALTTPPQTLHLDNPHHLNRVCVRLDCDAGTLEFTNADTDAHLFMFSHCFTEMVYPYFESVSVGGSLAVLAQRVNVSVGSDYVPVQHALIVGEDQAVKSDFSPGKDVITAASKMEIGHLTEDKKSALKQEKATKPTKDTSNNKNETKKQTGRIRARQTYHISLNRALNNIANERDNHKHT